MSSEAATASPSAARVRRLVAFFGFIGASHYLFATPYNGYLIAFVVMLVAAARSGRLRPGSISITASKSGVMIAFLVASCAVTFEGGSEWRDMLRDGGVLLAFVIGRFALPAWIGSQRGKELLHAMSFLGIIDSVVTLVSAAAAYHAGADAYSWRGEYVPVFHTWIPYLLLSNFALARLEPARRRIYWRRAAWCVMATVASLSRTDILLYVVLAAATAITHRRAMFASARRTATVLVAVLAAALVGYAAMGLSVVQERVDVGVSEDDPSLGWRLIEDIALLDYFDENSALTMVTGFGWGARVPLPPGITDFDDNDSIPFLHNSFLTVMLKFGLAGLAVLAAYITSRLRFAWRMRNSDAAPWVTMGAWMLLFNLADAVTLQGLTQWAQVMFFGIGCAMLSSSHSFAPGTGPARQRSPSPRPVLPMPASE